MDTTFHPIAAGSSVATASAAPALPGARGTTTRPSIRGGARRGAVWTGRVLSGLASGFLILDGGIKLSGIDAVAKGCAELGYPLAAIGPIGILLLTCVAVYLIPRTAILGAVLLTGYLGGAVATHVRVGHPLLSHTLFPIYVAAFIWAGLYLRDPRARSLLAPR